MQPITEQKPAWTSRRMPARGNKTFSMERKSCGCRVIQWSDGVVTRSGCEIHGFAVFFRCPKCKQQFENFKKLRDHRWEHSY